MVETHAPPEAAGALRDLRSWLAAVDAIGELRTIEAPVDAVEEMSAIAYLISRTDRPSAVLFSNVQGSAPGVRSLFCMVGASRRRLAITIQPVVVAIAVRRRAVMRRGSVEVQAQRVETLGGSFETACECQHRYEDE